MDPPMNALLTGRICTNHHRAARTGGEFESSPPSSRLMKKSQVSALRGLRFLRDRGQHSVRGHTLVTENREPLRAACATAVSALELLQRLRRDVHEAVTTTCGRQLAVEDQPVDLCAVHSEVAGGLGHPNRACGIDITVPPSQVRKVGQELLHHDASRFLDAGSDRVRRVLRRGAPGDFRLVVAEADLATITLLQPSPA